MKPTIEEVKKVAIECGMNDSVPLLYLAELQAFAQHWMKEQRESDEKLLKAQKFMVLQPLQTYSANDLYECKKRLTHSFAEAIRNNTGE